MKQIRGMVEYNLFGVCSYLGEKFNIATSRIRLMFIYVSFLTFGSPVVLYFVVAFWVNIKRYIFFRKRNPIWYN